MPARKAARSRRDWYSVSVDTLRGLGLLLAILSSILLILYIYRVWDRQSLEREAKEVIEEAGFLLQRLKDDKRIARFANEYGSARQSWQEAEAKFATQDFAGAVESGRRSLNVLRLLGDQLEQPGAAGQARFITIEGEVEYRRGDTGDWQTARTRVQLQPGDSVRTSDSGSAEMFVGGSLYTVRPNTQFIVSPVSAGSAESAEQSIEMAYGWVDLSTSDQSSNVRTPRAMARVREKSEAFVSVDKETSRGRFGAYQGTVELSAKGGLTREIKALEQVVQTGDLLSETRSLPRSPEALTPGDNEMIDLDHTRRLVLSWTAVPGAGRYALEISRNQLFVDNLIDVENRTRTQATLDVRGEGSFYWRIAAFGANGLPGPWSRARKFRVASSRSAGGNEKRDTTPPELNIDEVKTYGSIFMVAGRSEAGARIEVNGEQFKAGVDGTFTKPVQLTKEGWNIIEIRARDAWGNETMRRHRVFVESP